MINGHDRDDCLHINHAGHAQAIASRLEKPYSPFFDACISRTLDGKLMGGVLYQNYTGRAIVMHVAGAHRRWLTRAAIYVAFYYPFEQLRVEKVVGLVPSTNQHALAFDRKLGFISEGDLDGIVPDGKLVILSMRREQCRWLDYNPKGLKVIQHTEPHHGPVSESSTSARLQ